MAVDLVDFNGVSRDFFFTHIRSDGRAISAGAEAVHGLSSRAAARRGVSELAALGMLVGFAAQASYLVAFNSFDRDVLISVLAKLGKDSRMLVRSGLELIGVQDFAKAVCKLPGGDDGQHRRPTLGEACDLILGEKRADGPHSAWDDLCAMRRLFFALRDRGVIALEGLAA